MNFSRLSQIEDLAKSALRKANEYKVGPDLDKLVENFGLKVVGHEFGDDISGLLIFNEGEAIIAYNNSHSDVRKRFTIAHELGHFLLNHHGNGIMVDTGAKKTLHHYLFRDANSSTGEQLQEREANAFAAALLMPKELLEEKLGEYSFDLGEETDDFIKKIATEFRVSKHAMTLRLINIGILSQQPL